MDTYNAPVRIGRGMATATTVLFSVITIWWFFIHPFAQNLAIEIKHFWSGWYFILSLTGGIFGLFASHYWGGYKSLIGRAVLAFAVGLFLQTFGQLVYNYYTLFATIEAPYPSLGDVGFFGSVIAYVWAAVTLAHATGIQFSIKSIRNKILAVILPVAMLVYSYYFFLQGYQYSGSAITTFLDFGYPLGQAIYVSIALLVVLMSQNYLGGRMKKPIQLLLLALIVQYACDFDFLYKAQHGSWYAGGIGDYLYVVSYFLMTLALVNIGRIRFAMNAAQ